MEATLALVDARCGAPGVIGEDRRLAEFVPVGVPDEVRERIGALPQGHGILGLLIRHPAPVRIAEISEHPDFCGFPEHHPPMHSFLGVPVRVRGEIFGNLYLTDNRSAKEFDAEDESAVSVLAVVAGVAIDNARLLAEGRLGRPGQPLPERSRTVCCRAGHRRRCYGSSSSTPGGTSPPT
ncbi:GAF domain-containing protein [Actinacidiphila sp. bgisy160]|uniref:GAF domain-containing protein n=1 Tax=Actinacidiphila sp. bgisy160 TaxID=3413796 RepID=UPI003D73617B